MQDVHDLGLMIDRNIPIVVIETHEELRVLELLTRLAMNRHLLVQRWSLTDGLGRLGFGEDALVENSESPDVALTHIKMQEESGLYVFCDLHPFIEQPTIVRLLKDIALQYEQFHKTLVLVSHQLNIAPELQRLSACFSMTLPNEQQLMSLVKEEARAYAKRTGSRVKSDGATLQQLVANLRGVTYSDAQRLVRGAIVHDGAITKTDVPEVSKAKMKLMDMEGVLGFEYETASFADVAGLNNLKQWLEMREQAFFSTDSSIRPKGLMLFGVQGSGKSLAAKAVAGAWQIPLLRMDMGLLYNKFFGETERNLREALKLAEVMAPCVLWIDEVEKGLAGDQNDSGVSQRVLGTLLTWMAERSSSVFVVATANNILQLPPELMRKGRMDEIFFVDLPGSEVRRHIFSIHLEKRRADIRHIDLDVLALFSDGFSGAEIEQAVVSACHSARYANGSPSVRTEDLLQEIQSTHPLSITMAEQLEALRDWAEGRAVPADDVC
ncbi:MAG: AAA family ATPase [Oceanobacter sp.]